MRHPTAPRLVPDSVLAARLGVRARWLRAEADAGRIPGVRADDRYLFDPAAVERALLARASAAPQKPAPPKRITKTTSKRSPRAALTTLDVDHGAE